MSWTNLGTIICQENWQLSQPFSSGNLIRIHQNITTLSIGEIPSIKVGLIGLLIEGDHFFGIQQFFSDPESQLFYFKNLGFSSYQVAIKNISRWRSGDSWGINCFVYGGVI